MGTRDLGRQQQRATKLRRHAERYRAARLALHQVHSEGKRSGSRFLIRRSFVQRRTNAETVQDAKFSPASAWITQKGSALPLYLIALFEAQTRSTVGSEIRNTRPLYTTNEQRGWVDLLPAATVTADTTAGMRRQLTRALTQLVHYHLVELRGRAGIRNRYEGFQLRNEAGTAFNAWRSGEWTPGRYTIPAADDTDVDDPFGAPAAKDGQTEALRLPAFFFLNGWVHVLSAAEIVTYLMIRDLETRYPRASQRGVFVTDPNRLGWYGISRDVYESHRQLAAFGLIESLPDPNRRTDGSISRRPGGGTHLQPLRFRSVSKGLEQPALRKVIAALNRAGQP